MEKITIFFAMTRKVLASTPSLAPRLPIDLKTCIVRPDRSENFQLRTANNDFKIASMVLVRRLDSGLHCWHY
jgi:hypothetical protein